MGRLFDTEHAALCSAPWLSWCTVSAPTYPWELTASLEIDPAKSVKVHHITDFLDEEVSKR